MAINSYQKKPLIIPAASNVKTKFKTFTMEYTCYLKDTNAYGNMYFSKYFELQGMCREKWFCEEICPNMFSLNGILATIKADTDYLKEVKPFEKLSISLNTYQVKKSSFKLSFKYLNGKNQLIGKGFQKIAFLYLDERKIQKFPEELLDKIRHYSIS